KTDLTLPPNVRAYLFAGSQHGPAAWPPAAARAADGPNSRGTGQQLGTPTWHIELRALLMSLDRWVRDGTEPPASKYPRLSDGSLTPGGPLKGPGLPHAPPPHP